MQKGFSKSSFTGDRSDSNNRKIFTKGLQEFNACPKLMAFALLVDLP